MQVHVLLALLMFQKVHFPPCPQVLDHCVELVSTSGSAVPRHKYVSPRDKRLLVELRSFFLIPDKRDPPRW